MIRLASDALAVELDSAVGGEVLAVRGPDGRNVLYETPWDADERAERGADGDSWVRGWRGGWQLLFPNAGEPCVVDGVDHPFHGDFALGGTTPLEGADGTTAEVAWQTDTWSVRRAYATRGDTLRITTHVANRSDRPAAHVAVEHPILAERFATPPARLRFPVAEAMALSETGGPTTAVVETERWAETANPPDLRFGSMAAGTGVAGAEVGDAAVELRWDVTALPWMWFWLEAEATTAEPWNGRVRCVALEPAAAPTGDGLAEAALRGQARVVPAGGTESWWIEMTVRAVGD